MMLITLQSYNRLIPKNCENRHFDVEAEVVPFCPMSHRWDKWDKVGQVGQGWCALISQISHGWEKWEMASRRKARKKRGSHLAAPELVFCLVVWL